MIIEEDKVELYDPTDLSLFGFTIIDDKKTSQKKSSKKQSDEKQENALATKNLETGKASFIQPQQDDGSSVVVGVGGHHHLSYYDLDPQSATSDISRIRKYREISQFPEVDQAIEEIINEMIVFDDEGNCIEIRFDEAQGIDHNDKTDKSSGKIPDKIKKYIIREFDEILELLNFEQNGHDLARRWYIDGRLIFQIMADLDEKRIKELREIDPTKIKKIKEVEESIDPRTGSKLYTLKKEFFIYKDGSSSNNVFGNNTIDGLPISKDSIVYCTSGLLDESRKNVISYLQKVLKVANQVKMLEDSMVIYRLARAPERRVFYVDTGNLPAKKAEAYLEQVITKFRNKISYNAVTGETTDARNTMAMVEDFWLPRCLALDTEIKMLDGSIKTLETLIDEHEQGIENWTYSVSPNGTIVPGLISWAGRTRSNTEVVRVTLDNGKSITCTPDHKFILRNGEKREAQHLKPNDSLMPLYEDVNGDIIDIDHCNHKVTSVEFLDDKIDTGTLTIDGDHIHHDYHNFALAAGIFVMNSGSGRGTEISTLAGGQALSSIDDLEYFHKKLFRALNVPLNRLEQEAQFSLGRTSEISRDEVKFSKFISRLRLRFSSMFYQLLKVQLVLKNIITLEEWTEYKKYIYFDFLKDNHFTEMKDIEIMQTRLSTLRDLNDYVGNYVSKNWVRKNVLRQSEEEIEEIDKEIEEDKKNTDPNDDEQQSSRW